jgi:hypothetical protein
VRLHLSRVGYLMLLLCVVSCGTASARSSSPSPLSARSYLPIKNTYSHLFTRPINQIVSSQEIKSAVDFDQPTETWGYSPQYGFLVPEWLPPAGGRAVGYADGLFLVDPKSGTVSKVVSFAKYEQPDTGAIYGEWIAWSEGYASLGGPLFGDVFVKNLRNGKTLTAYVVPKGAVAGRDPFGLSFQNGALYWLETLNRPSGEVVSEIMRYDLRRHLLRVLLRYSSTSNHKIVFWISVANKRIFFSVDQSGNVWNTEAPGYIAEMDLRSGHTTTILPLPHAPTVVQATQEGVAFLDNYQREPNSPSNAAPFPLYLYVPGRRSVDRLTPPFPAPFSNPSFPSSWGRYLTWWDKPCLLLDLRQFRIYVVPGYFSEVNNGYLTWWNAGRLYWSRLP